ncbi:hypothetical protein Hte_001275 [Hypoxylon texense]
MELPYLPEELWEQIFFNLHPVDMNGREVMDPLGDVLSRPSPALLNISRTSKKFRRIAAPILYRNLVVDDDPTRVRLIRTLIENPALRQHVRTLGVYGGPSWYPPTVEELETAYRAFNAAQTELGLTTKLRQAFARGLQEAEDNESQHLLLVALCPRLRQLVLGTELKTNLFQEVLRESSGARKLADEPVGQLLATGHLSQLRKLRLCLGMNSVRTLQFSLPQLTTLVLRRCVNVNEKDLVHIPKGLGLQHLNLHEPYLDRVDLRELLCSYPKLRTFRIRLTRSWNNFPRSHLDELGTALRGYGENGSPSLESLIVDYTTEKMLDPGTFETGTIGSLLPLSNLKRLHIKLENLVGERYWYRDPTNDPFEGPPVRLDEQLPDSLEILEVQVPVVWNIYYPYHLISYFHCNVVALISNGLRANLRRILLLYAGGEYTILSYTKNDGGFGWTLTIHNTQQEYAIYEALDGCPMVEDGYVSVESGAYVADAESRVDDEDIW